MEPYELIDFGKRAVKEGLERLAATLKYNFFISGTKKKVSGVQVHKKYVKLNITYTRPDGKTGTLISTIMRELKPDWTEQRPITNSKETGTVFMHDKSTPTKATIKEAEDALTFGWPQKAPEIKVQISPAPTPPPVIKTPPPTAVAPPVVLPPAPAPTYYQKNWPTVINPRGLEFLGPLTLDNVPIWGLIYHDKGVTNFTNVWTPEEAIKQFPDQF